MGQVHSEGRPVFSLAMMLTDMQFAKDDNHASDAKCRNYQGELLLMSFHAEYEKDPAGRETEFFRGDFVGWRDTLHTLYHDCAEEIVDRVIAKTCLTIPDALVHSSAL
ncbi:MAG: hypothetical protein WBQ39_16275 [Terriglobales bacterium]